MDTKHLALVALISSTIAGSAQFNYNFAFNSGSNGTNGPLNVTTDTNLDLPPDGIFNFTTINIAAGATLTFNRNFANTPVYVLATGNVTIAGTIDVSGQGAAGLVAGASGPGGFDGGYPGFNGLPPGDGRGPGGGGAATPYWGGSGAYATFPAQPCNNAIRGTVYGSPLLVPLIGGSGGGGSVGYGLGGAGGGGAILISSSTSINVSGAIVAKGGGICGQYGIPCAGAGSGGGIRLVAPVVQGTGVLNAQGGVVGCCNPGGDGRIRIDSLDRRNATFNWSPTPSFGSFMVSFPSVHLDIINVGGTNIAQGSGPVSIQFPNNSSTNQTVTVKASNFNSQITTIVAVTPQNGSKSTYSMTIDNAASNPATNSVNVVIPPNVIVTINAWTQVP